MQPHSRGQQRVAARKTLPAEEVRARFIAADRVDVALGAAPVPEPAAGARRAVPRRPLVVVAISRREHRAAAVAESVATRVTRVPGRVQHIVRRLLLHSERAVLGVVPVAGVVTRLQIELELVAAGRREVTEQLVAEPVVAAVVVETDLVLFPRTIKVVGIVYLLLYQQRNAACCRTIAFVIRLR